MRAYVDRSRSIEAMWVLNQDGKILYASTDREDAGVSNDDSLRENLRRGATTIASRRVDGATYYDVLVPLQMPRGARGPGGLRLWINPADWTELLSGLWRQLALLFVLAAGVAVGGAYLITTLYTRRFRLIRDTLRQAAAGTYRSRPPYASRDEVAASLDLIDRLVMKQRGAAASPTPLQRLAVAARALAHEVRTPLNALAVHLQLLGQADDQGSPAIPDRRERSLAAADASIRQVEQLVRDFTDYSAPAAMERERLDVAAVLAATLDAMKPVCAGRGIDLARELPLGPWPLTGDATRLRQIFDNLLRNALEALPNGGTIRVEGRMEDGKVILDFADTGPGIPPERRPALFDFGRSTKPGGSGIGLPLSQLIAEAHGGTLSYVADDGRSRGALFRLQLPLEPVAQ
jgi:signal transduction histidine kinase